jgi:hypothetical protein
MKRRRRGQKRTRKVILAELAVGIVVATACFAFAAAVVVPATKAGEGVGTVDKSSILATQVVYTLDVDTPTKIASVSLTFSAAKAPTSVYAKIGGVQSQACTGGGTAWTCAWTAANEQSIPGNNTTLLEVTAAA